MPKIKGQILRLSLLREQNSGFAQCMRDAQFIIDVGIDLACFHNDETAGIERRPDFVDDRSGDAGKIIPALDCEIEAAANRANHVLVDGIVLRAKGHDHKNICLELTLCHRLAKNRIDMHPAIGRGVIMNGFLSIMQL
jgi:hypothetical protein